MHYKIRILACLMMATAWTAASTAARAADADGHRLIERGRYVAHTAGCNDCHTPGYGAAEGTVSESLWLTGDQVGWRGPWGTTYPTNLRLYMNQISEDAWVNIARVFRPRPPMPWFNVHAMSEDDLRALYRFVRYLGPAGKPAPAYVPPDKTPTGPVVRFPD